MIIKIQSETLHELKKELVKVGKTAVKFEMGSNCSGLSCGGNF